MDKKVNFNYEGYEFDNELRIPLGVDLKTGEVVYWEFTEPQGSHLLLGGSTGSGKSKTLSVILAHIVKHLNEDVEVYLHDEKMIDLCEFKDVNIVNYYNGFKISLYEEVGSIVDEMNLRYEKMKDTGVKSIAEYNHKFNYDKMKYKLLIIDNFSDFSISNYEDKKYFYPNLSEIMAKGRGVGIQVVISTQVVNKSSVPQSIKSNMNTIIGLHCNTLESSLSICSTAHELIGLKGCGHANIFVNGSKTELQIFDVQNETIRNIINENNK